MSAAGDAPWVVVYDGQCRVCLRTVNILRDRDRDGLFEMVSYQTPGVKDRFPDIPESAFRESVQLIGPDGSRRESASAVEKILDLLPRGRWLSWIFRIPLVRPIAERVYRLFARNRHRLGCSDHCPVEVSRW